MSNIQKILSPTPEKGATSRHQQPSGVRLVNNAHLEKEMNICYAALEKHRANPVSQVDIGSRTYHSDMDKHKETEKNLLQRAKDAHQALINAKHPIASHGWSPGHKIFGFTRKDHLGHVIKGGRKKRTRRHSRKKRHTRHKRKRRRRKHRRTCRCRRRRRRRRRR